MISEHSCFTPSNPLKVTNDCHKTVDEININVGIQIKFIHLLIVKEISTLIRGKEKEDIHSSNYLLYFV